MITLAFVVAWTIPIRRIQYIKIKGMSNVGPTCAIKYINNIRGIAIKFYRLNWRHDRLLQLNFTIWIWRCETSNHVNSFYFPVFLIWIQQIGSKSLTWWWYWLFSFWMVCFQRLWIGCSLNLFSKCYFTKKWLMKNNYHFNNFDDHIIWRNTWFQKFLIIPLSNNFTTF